MQDEVLLNIPIQYENILNNTKESGFRMASDLYTGSLLKTLVASKPGASILEFGTGTGLATSWILGGMDINAKLLTIDNNQLLMSIAKQNLKDKRIDFVCTDGYKWIVEYKGPPFDFIFADAMGKPDSLVAFNMFSY